MEWLAAAETSGAARRESTPIFPRSIPYHRLTHYPGATMQHQLQTNLDSLNNHGFGRAGLETPAYVTEVLAALPTTPSANDDGSYVDLAQRVREGGEW